MKGEGAIAVARKKLALIAKVFLLLILVFVLYCACSKLS